MLTYKHVDETLVEIFGYPVIQRLIWEQRFDDESMTFKIKVTLTYEDPNNKRIA